jgi:hypothetical protein
MRGKIPSYLAPVKPDALQDQLERIQQVRLGLARSFAPRNPGRNLLHQTGGWDPGFNREAGSALVAQLQLNLAW